MPNRDDLIELAKRYGISEYEDKPVGDLTKAKLDDAIEAVRVEAAKAGLDVDALQPEEIAEKLKALDAAEPPVPPQEMKPTLRVEATPAVDVQGLGAELAGFSEDGWEVDFAGQIVAEGQIVKLWCSGANLDESMALMLVVDDLKKANVSLEVEVMFDASGEPMARIAPAAVDEDYPLQPAHAGSVHRIVNQLTDVLQVWYDENRSPAGAEGAELTALPEAIAFLRAEADGLKSASHA